MAKRELLSMKKTKTNIKQKSENTTNGEYDFFESFQLVNSWIHAADNKISIMSAIFFGVYTVIGGYNISFFCSIENYNDVKMPTIFALIIFIISNVLFILSVIFCAHALIPNIIKVNNNKKNLFFYKDIASFKDPSDFKNHCDKINNEQIKLDLSEEIYINSKICYKKMKICKMMIIFSILSIIFQIATVFLSLICL